MLAAQLAAELSAFGLTAVGGAPLSGGSPGALITGSWSVAGVGGCFGGPSGALVDGGGGFSTAWRGCGCRLVGSCGTTIEVVCTTSGGAALVAAFVAGCGNAFLF